MSIYEESRPLSNLLHTANIRLVYSAKEDFFMLVSDDDNERQRYGIPVLSHQAVKLLSQTLSKLSEKT